MTHESVTITLRPGAPVVNLSTLLNSTLIDEATALHDEVPFPSRANCFAIGWLLYLLRVHRKNSREQVKMIKVLTVK